MPWKQVQGSIPCLLREQRTHYLEDDANEGAVKLGEGPSSTARSSEPLTYRCSRNYAVLGWRILLLEVMQEEEEIIEMQEEPRRKSGRTLLTSRYENVTESGSKLFHTHKCS